MYLLKLPDAPNRDDVREIIAKLDKSIAEDQANRASPPAGTKPPSTGTPHALLQPVAGEARAQARKPLYKRWYVWTAVGAVVAAGLAVALGVGLSQGTSYPSANANATVRF